MRHPGTHIAVLVPDKQDRIAANPDESAAETLFRVEKRKYNRQPLTGSIRITCISAEGTVEFTGECIDIGPDGIAFETKAVLDFYKPLQLDFLNNDGKRCVRQAKLLYRASRRYGAYFERAGG